MGYNFIYSQLVSDKDDIIGSIAYALYKKQKIEWIKDFANKKGREPTKRDMESFHTMTNGDESLSHYREVAGNLAQEFALNLFDKDLKKMKGYYRDQAVQVANKILTQKSRELSADYKDLAIELALRELERNSEVMSLNKEEIISEIHSCLERPLVGKVTWWRNYLHGATQSCLGSLLFLLFGIIILLISWGLQFGPVEIVESIFNVEIVQNPPSIPDND